MNASISLGSGKLDALRSFAVCLVLLSHLPISATISNLVFGEVNFHLQAVGLLGVAIFFVHTCLVLMMSLERQSARQGEAHLALIFLVRRAFRIYPLSIATVLILAALGWSAAGSRHAYVGIISNILLIQNITGHPSNPPALWSLPFEVQMYLVLPFVFLYVTAQGTRAVSAVLLIWFASAALVLVVWALGWDYQLIKYFPTFLPGVMAYSLQGRKPSLPATILVAYLALIVAIYPVLVARGVSEGALLWPICLALGVLIACSKEMIDGPVRAIVGQIAKYSYGIYLVHGPMIDFSFIHLKGHSVVFQWASFVMGTVLLSYVAFHLIEKPGIDIGTRLSNAMGRSRINARVREG